MNNVSTGLVEKIFDMPVRRRQVLFQGMELYPALIQLTKQNKDLSPQQRYTIIENEKKMITHKYHLQDWEFVELDTFVQEHRLEGNSMYKYFMGVYLQ